MSDSNKSKTPLVEKSDLLKELLNKQLKNVPTSKKLQFSDMKRICKYINSSIFDEDHCCIWDGYVTNINNKSKGTYINFFFSKKKVALHRLLYNNFVGVLEDNEYLKFSCEYKGQCCNIFHLKKFKYQEKDEDKKKKKKKKKVEEPVNFFLDFD